MTTFHLRWPDPEEMTRFGFDGVRDVPFILDGEGKYHDEASWYLRERALMEWSPERHGPALFASRYPTSASMRTYGYALVNFLEWTSECQRDWRTLDYTKDVLLSYQAMMLDGQWSAANRELSPSTVTQRVDEACSFLSWAAAKSLRDEFKIVTSTVRVIRPRKKSPQETQVQRVGRVRPAATSLHMPSPDSIAKWLGSVEVRSGKTKALLCETIVGSGIRREEAVQLRKTSIPPTTEIVGLADDADIQIEISFGAKGSKTRNRAGELEGPRRDIFMKAALVKKLCLYRDGLRNEALAVYVRKAESIEERRRRIRSHSNRLFISEYTGQPITWERLYDAWTLAPHSPYPGWSPHAGRHYWACHKLLTLMKEESDISKASARRDPQGFDSTARNLLQIVIQPQLGHVDEKTTLLYLRWLRHSYLAKNIIEDWTCELDTEK